MHKDMAQKFEREEEMNKDLQREGALDEQLKKF